MNKTIEFFKALPLFKTPVLPYFRSIELRGIVSNAGHEIITGPGYSFNGLERGDKGLAVIQLTLEGQGALRYEDRTHTLEPGDCMLVSIPHDHCYYFPDDASCWEFVYICVSGEEFLRLIETLLTDGDPVFRVLEHPSIIQAMKEVLSHVSIDKTADEFLLSGSVYRMLMQLISNKFGSGEKTVQTDMSKNVTFTLDFCRTNIHKSFSVEEISAQLGIHRSHLSREFKKVRGISLKEHLENLRMEKAVKLLLQGQLSISRIGRECGYDDLNYFCRVFKKRFDQSPGEYRKGYLYLYG